ncbi:MAG: hypothetical protein AAF331_08830 [Pseudomonadota bacterium]
MSISELSARSGHFRSRIKRRNLIEYLAAALVVGIFGWMAFIVPVPSIKIGAVMIAMAAVYISWQLNRVASVSEDDAPEENLAHAHRRALVRQRDALRSVWRWYLLPFVPGMLVFVLGTSVETGETLPIWAVISTSLVSLGFVSAVFAGVWAMNAFAARKLDREITALDNVTIIE